MTTKELFFLVALALFVGGAFVTTLAFLPVLAACGIAAFSAALAVAAMWHYTPAEIKIKTNHEGG